MSAADNEMLDLFVQESSEHIESLETDLIALEANPSDTSRLNSIFRSVHSIKGAAGFFGFEPIVKLAHVMESVMSLLRDGLLHADESMVSLLISSSDKLRAMLGDPDHASNIPCASEAAGLQAILDGQHGSRASSPQAPSASQPPSNDLPDAQLEGFVFTAGDLKPALKLNQNFYVLRMGLELDIEAQGQSVEHFFKELKSLGTVLDIATSLPAGAGLENCADCDIECRAFFTTALEPFILSGALGLAEDRIAKISNDTLRAWSKSQPADEAPTKEATPSATPAPPVEASIVPASKPLHKSPDAAPTPAAPTPIDPKPVPGGARRKTEETIRINVSLLDSLMNLAGEMVLGRNRLLRLAGKSASDSDTSEMQSVVQEISSVTSSLQDTIMRARLQPVGGLFGKFTRIVRDLSHKLSKEIQLEIFGEDVELDRTLLEGLSDPLTHLVRNSVDHGIEKPADRLAKGKPACGLVRLSAAHLAGRVQIEVLDDGGGMDPERLKAKAIEKGLITPEQAARMPDSEAFGLIFAAGFSTAAAVSDISGRGVGMDVVKTNIEKLGGHVELDSRLGEGTRIIIRLPLTLAIVPALVVGCRGMSYALPQINVDEIVRPGEEYPLKTMGGARVLQLRGQLMPVVDLSELLGYATDPADRREAFVVVLRLDHVSYGLVVDEIISNEEIVVKPLGRHLRTVPYYSGATLLGQGEIALILDPASMAQGRISASQGTLSAAKSAESTLVDTNSERVLLFQDGDGELLAIHLTKVMRVECIDGADVERIGTLDCLRKNHDSTLRLVQLSDLLPVKPAESRPKEYFLIVPRAPYDGLGIVASRIVDSADLSPDQIDRKTYVVRGLQGSAVLLERLTLVLDFEAIADMLAEGGDPTSLVAQGHFLLTANSQQASPQAPLKNISQQHTLTSSNP